MLDGYRCKYWCPEWLWLWAVRRVDRWHEQQRHQELLDIWARQEAEQDERYAAMFEKTWANFPRKSGSSTLTGKLHR